MNIFIFLSSFSKKKLWWKTKRDQYITLHQKLLQWHQGMGPRVKHVFGVLEWFYMLNAKILFQNRTLAKDNFFIFLRILPTITSKNLPFLPWILFQHLSQPCGSCCKNIFKQRWIFLVKIKSRSHLLCWTKMACVYLGGSTVHTLNWQAQVTEQPIIRGYYISPGYI